MVQQSTMTVLLGREEYLLIAKNGDCFVVMEDPVMPGASLLTYMRTIEPDQYQELKEIVSNVEASFALVEHSSLGA